LVAVTVIRSLAALVSLSFRVVAVLLGKEVISVRQEVLWQIFVASF
jgi:hypothetical protein